MSQLAACGICAGKDGSVRICGALGQPLRVAADAQRSRDGGCGGPGAHGAVRRPEPRGGACGKAVHRAFLQGLFCISAPVPTCGASSTLLYYDGTMALRRARSAKCPAPSCLANPLPGNGPALDGSAASASPRRRPCRTCSCCIASSARTQATAGCSAPGQTRSPRPGGCRRPRCTSRRARPLWLIRVDTMGRSLPARLIWRRIVLSSFSRQLSHFSMPRCGRVGVAHTVQTRPAALRVHLVHAGRAVQPCHAANCDGRSLRNRSG